MRRLITAIILIVSSMVQANSAPPPNPDLSTWLTNGNPWQVAARCYAAMLFYPSIEFNGEAETLMRIIVTDPHLSADVSLNISPYAVKTDRGLTLDLVGKHIHGTFGTLRIYNYNPADIEHACNFFIK